MKNFGFFVKTANNFHSIAYNSITEINRIGALNKGYDKNISV